MKPRALRSSNGFYQYSFSDPHVRAYTSTRLFNARFEEEAVGERQKLLRALNLESSRLVGANQTHGNTIQKVQTEDGGRGAIFEKDAFQDTDGFITQTSLVALSIKTADCLPLFLVDPFSHAFSALHAGWRGIQAGIIEKGIEMMKKDFHSRPEEIEVVLGPSVRFEDYEVGEDFLKIFPGFVRKPFDSAQGKLHFDLPCCVFDRLVREEINPENILDTQLSTYQLPQDFYSYRREGEGGGRMLSLIWRDE